jgi:hypothetical protein
MLSPLAGFQEREILGVFKVATAMASGLAVGIDSTNTAPLNPSPYGNSFGSVVVASPAVTFTQSGTTPFAVSSISHTREIGYLLQPVTTNGPSLLSVLSQVYDESVAAGNTAAVLLAKAGGIIATDQYLTTTGQAIKFDGSVSLGAVCSIVNGVTQLQTGAQASRSIFLGKIVQRNLPLGVFQIQ